MLGHTRLVWVAKALGLGGFGLLVFGIQAWSDVGPGGLVN